MSTQWSILVLLAYAPLLRGEMKIVAISGSTRKESINTKLLREAAHLAQQHGGNVTLINLRDYALPLYDGDLEAQQGLPPAAKKLRKLMIESDLIIIASPEYNSSLSGVLKNTIDWISRGEDGSGSNIPFANKRFLIISASPSARGGERGLVHLRGILQALQGNVLPDQLTVPDAYNAFDAAGHLKNPTLQERLQKLISSLFSNSSQ